MHIVDTYIGASGVVTGSARRTKEAEDRAAAAVLVDEIARNEALRGVRRRALRRAGGHERDFVAEDAALDTYR